MAFTTDFAGRRGYEPRVERWINLTDKDLTFVSGPNETTYERAGMDTEVMARANIHVDPVIVGGSYPVDTWKTPELGSNDLPKMDEDCFINYFVHEVVFKQNPDRKDIFFAHTVKRGKKNIVDYIERH